MLDQPDVIVSAEALAAGIPMSTLVGLAGASHLPGMERPEAFSLAVRAFPASLAGDRPGSR